MGGIYYPQARAHLIWWPYVISHQEVEEVRAAFDAKPSPDGDQDGAIARALEQLVAASNIIPRSVTVVHNDVFTADTFEVEVDEYLFRVDPRDVRALMVDVRMGGVSRPGEPLPVGADDPRQIYGHADEITQTYRTDGASSVWAKGRDYTGLLLDEKWQGRRIELGRTIVEMVEEALAPVTALRPLEVIASPGLEDARIEKGARKRDRFFTVSPETSLWEGILELTMRAGLMLVVEVDKLVIQPPRNVYTEDRARSPLFIEGVNLKELKIERNLGTADLPAVQIAAYDRASGKVIKGTWPATRKVARITKGKRSEDVTIQRFFVRVGAPTEAGLTALAKRVFSLYARQQLTISFSTRDLAVAIDEGSEQFNRRGQSSQLTPSTAVRNGSSVRVRLDPSVRNVLAREYTPQKTERELRQMGYTDQVASILARTWRPIEQVLFVNTATHSFNESGYQLSVSAQNFIEVGIS